MASESTTNLVSMWARKDSGVSDLAEHNGHYWPNSESKLEITEEIPSTKKQENESDCGTDSNAPSIAEQPKWRALYERLCPPRGPVAKWTTWCLVCLLIFGVFWSLAPEHMKPGQSIFGLFVTIILCFVSEVLIEKIPTCKGYPPLPRLLASLLMGLALANLPPPVNVASYIDGHWSWTLRNLSLAVILTRAGLELDPTAMQKVKWAVVRLAFLPCIGETIAIGVFAHYILGFPFEWSFMMGFLIAAVSPAVVIPSLILLQEKRLGVEKGIPSLVMAASGIDDVLAIGNQSRDISSVLCSNESYFSPAGFTVLLGIAIPAKLEAQIVEGKDQTASLYTTFSPTNTTGGEEAIDHNIGLEIAGALVEVVIGICAGLVCGFLISYIPHNTMEYKGFCRGVFLLGTGIFAVFASDYWGIPGSGALWALITSFVASLHWKEGCKPLEKSWHYMWLIFQPILFGLTGATVDVKMMDGETVGLGLAVLALGLMFRMLVSTSVTWGLNFKMKEKLFVSIAWIPKGTVQAALGSAALDTAIALNRPEQEIRWGEQILVLAVLVTLITAPIGAFGITISGPKLLEAAPPPGGIDNAAFDSDVESEIHRHKCSSSSDNTDVFEVDSTKCNEETEQTQI